jgi:hypothetical protein
MVYYVRKTQKTKMVECVYYRQDYLQRVPPRAVKSQIG